MTRIKQVGTRVLVVTLIAGLIGYILLLIWALRTWKPEQVEEG